MQMTTDAGYPQLFRQMIVRSTETALAAIDPKAIKLGKEERERSLCALDLALRLAAAWPAAWPAAADLTLTLAPHMEMQGSGAAWVACLEMAAAQAREQHDLHLLARLYLQLGRVQSLIDEYAAAEATLQKAHTLAGEIPDADVQARALLRLAQTAAEAGDFQRAKLLVEQVLPVVSENSPIRGHCDSILGVIALRQGDWDAAIPLYQRSLHILAAAGEPRFVAQAERTLALAYRYAKQYDKAIEHLQQSLKITAALNIPYDQAVTQMDLAVAYWYLGQYQEALSLYAQCEPVFVNCGSKLQLGHLYNNRGLALRDLLRTDEAQDAFFASIKIMRELNLPLWVANALESLGGLQQKMGNVAEAIATWEQALQELETLPETPRYLHDLITRRICEATRPTPVTFAT